ncbi:endo alpha-1,4 polygalactosaminidase [Microbacterium hydrocarbonoxydans]|uniref:endo alpha-1,4 polygalactosaminidase n=1 Tax=Microbacterium hydrocarbonoxydans TaxID=273678 RepID=UPI00203E852F|nr:endo alpha-1,4 polygalactosaminidase [Microbacterium hydrocarbonoxydans]MCM3779749.1 endo alpha-1,4 polygalactosaminidase [Microbacterium hydrocarbonoxydans]
MRRTASALVAAAILGIALVGCSHRQAEQGDAAALRSGDIALLPVGAVPDYQLGGAYDPADDVGIVGRDRTAEPADGVYSICYVNGFQTQPGELADWPDDLLLQRDGEPVFDPDWPDEALLDTSTAERRDRIADVVGSWIDSCAQSSFEAVEFDNLDSYTRSDDALSLGDNLALATLLVERAHEAGLAAGQKNAAEDAEALHDRAGFDFAVVEECAAYEECGAYTAIYGDQVIDIEYTDQLPRAFAEMCGDPESPGSMVLRDRDLLPAGVDGHVFETCR